MLHRYAEARAIAAGLADRAVKALARSLAEPGPSVLNPSPRARSGVVELVVPADGPAPANVQVLSERFGLPGSMVLDADTVRTVLGMLQGPKISDDAWIHDIRIEDTEEGMDITLSVGTEEKPGVPIAEAKQDVYTRLGRGPIRWCGSPWTSRRRGGSPPVPPRSPATAGAPSQPAPLAHPVEVSEAEGSVELTNGLVRVAVDPVSGTFALDGVRGYGRLVDGGDLGDSYNYSPPRQDSFVDSPESVTVRVDERGPVRARVHSTATYAWPDHIDGSSQARVGEHRVEVDTDVELRADDPVVRVTHDLREPERGPPPARAPPAPRAGSRVPGRECLHRRHPRP